MDSVLIVDDEVNVLSAITRVLVDEPYHVLTADSGMEGLRVLKETPVKVVVSDEKMPGMSGTEFLSAVRSMFPDTMRIMLTGHASVQAAMNAVNNGEIYRFFAKPWNDIELVLSIRSAIEKYNLEAENRELLKTVKRQEGELKQLEKLYPGISEIEKDQEGNLVLPDVTSADTDLFSQIISHPDMDELPG